MLLPPHVVLEPILKMRKLKLKASNNFREVRVQESGEVAFTPRHSGAQSLQLQQQPPAQGPANGGLSKNAC